MNKVIQTYIGGDSAVKIAEGFERAIDQGMMAAGESLPTVRALADLLGVSPGTAAAAYRRLRERGLVVTEGRRGTRVAPAARGGWQALSGQPALPAGLRDLSNGNPDPELLPDMQPHLSDLRPQTRLYGGPVSLPSLVDWSRRTFASDAIAEGPICVVSGALAGIERVLRESLRPGDAVAVEDPGFSNVFDLVRGIGLQLLPVAVDPEGPRPEALEAAISKGAKAFIVTPRAQNPTGAALTAPRAAALRAVLAGAPELLTIEDDFAGMVCHQSPHWLHAAGRPWAVVRSFSKALSPDLRLAILSGDAQTMGRVAERIGVTERWVSFVLQELALAMLQSDAVLAQVEAARSRYRARRESLLAALEAEGIMATGASGLNVWIPVPEESRMLQALAQRGWAVAAGARFRLESPRAIRITVASLSAEEAPRLACDIAEVRRGGAGSLAV